MDIKELEDFRLADAVKFHNKLNPALWTEKGKLDPEVKEQLLTIAKDFMAELGINSLKVEDITISGSNAAYTYTPHSDLDLHILVDFNKLPDDKVYQELFTAKKNLYNDNHDIKVHGVPVELYIQDSNQPVVSLGEYSLLKNEWIKIPKKRKANFDQNATKAKYEKLGNLVELAIKSQSLKRIEKVLDIIKRYRKAGLDSTGEFGPENIAFKALRSQGYIKKLYDLKNQLHSKELSIEDYHPNAKPRGPEFPPTMPAGTVKVDVSDVYDWYKLGQHISDLEGLGKHDFGKGPPSTILSFGDEDTEHKYIDNLMKTGLTTTDIDPKGHEPKKGQKVDPRYNVGEQGVAEAFDQPYKLKWEKGEFGDIDAYTILPDGSPLSIMFNKEDNGLWVAEFYRSNTQDVTGEGDAQKIFATVLHAVNQFIKKVKPKQITFSAVKENDPTGSRSSLYDRLVQRYASNLGYSVERHAASNKVSYDLIRQGKLKEASGSTFVYHVTPTKNLKSIAKQGLTPAVGNRSSKISGEQKGIYVFPDKVSAEDAVMNWLGDEFDDEPLTMLKIDVSGLEKDISKGADYELVINKTIEPNRIRKVNIDLSEASGYIPSEKEKNDPRFKTALTVDVKPDSIKKNARAFGFKVSRAGNPPLLRK